MILRHPFKSIALVAIAATMLTTSCTESYPSMEYDYSAAEGAISNQDVISKRVPMMLFVNPQNFFTVTASSRRSKAWGTGSGPFEQSDMDQYYNSVFYVYAFRKGQNIQGSTQTEPTDFRWTSYAKNNPGPYANDSVDHKDCLLDGEDYYVGLSTHLDKSGTGELKPVEIKDDKVVGELTHSGERFFYSPTYEDIPYDFFGYYFDNFKYKPNAHRDKDSIWYSNLTIDGTQDILFGKAAPLNDILTTDYADIWKKLTIDEQRQIHNISGYSTFAAHRGIHPTIDMKHMLSRLRFVIFPGDDTADDVIIDKVGVVSKNVANFVVAARDDNQLGLHFTAQKDTLWMDFPANEKLDTLKKRDGTPFLYNGKEIIGYRTETWADGAAFKGVQMGLPEYGKSLMLAPGDSLYILVLDWKQRIKVEKYDPVTDTKIYSDSVLAHRARYNVRVPQTDYNLKPGTNPKEYYFQPGIYYQVKIMVYGLQDMRIYTSIASWREEDQPIVINPDDEF